jgi:hypothetical protein
MVLLERSSKLRLGNVNLVALALWRTVISTMLNRWLEPACVLEAQYSLFRVLDYQQLIHICKTHDCIFHESIWE